MNVTKDDFGKKARDKITGFEGMITGINTFITGCDQILIQPPLKEDGTFVEARWFDDSRLEMVDERSSIERLFTDEEKRLARVGGPVRSNVTK